MVQYASDNIQETLDTIRIVQDKMKGTPQCFSVTPKYGAEADQLVGVWIAANSCPSIRVTGVCKDAETLNYIASRITMPFEYHGESYAAFGENLRLALCKHRRDMPQKIKDTVLTRQDHRCTVCCEVLDKWNTTTGCPWQMEVVTAKIIYKHFALCVMLTNPRESA